MKYLKKFEKYLSDGSIEKSYDGYKIVGFTVENFFDDDDGNKCYSCGASGWIDIEYDYDEDDEDDYAESRSDNWIKYDSGPKIAFDNWYPEKMNLELKEYIENGIIEEKIKRNAKKYNL